MLRRKNNRSMYTKFLVGALLLIIIITSSINVAFADRDIGSVLTNWFNKNEGESIAEIEQAIDSERQDQTERLKEELRLEIESSEQELNQFTETQKTDRTTELERYTDELIHNLSIDNEEEKNRIAEETEAIVQEAKEKIDNIERTEKPEPENEAEIEGQTEESEETTVKPEKEGEAEVEENEEEADLKKEDQSAVSQDEKGPELEEPEESETEK
ncbi:hypothetical protein ACUL41_00660 [Virgibacillus natechei]|uniref:hypothetical protein n=1 Tax=Virgibacillus sp. CBA3643 TaxID=2942278 RepID=UPI0035A3CBC7